MNKEWQELDDVCFEAHCLLRDEITHLIDGNGEKTPEITSTLRSLNWYLLERCNSIRFLACHGFLWDAEIILRAFYETCAKILYICFTDDAGKPELIEEFWAGLRPIADRRTAAKAEFAKRMFRPGSVSAAVFEVLQDPTLFELNDNRNKSERKRLEQKWSFSEIVEHLDESSGGPLKGAKSLLHIYGMASHLAHADHTALDLIEDRLTRGTAERILLEAGQFARLLSDQVNLHFFCFHAIRQNFKIETELPLEVTRALGRVRSISDRFSDEFDESQRAFYGSRTRKGP